MDGDYEVLRARSNALIRRRVTDLGTHTLVGRCEPVAVEEAVRIGLVDEVSAGPPAAFEEAVLEYATRLATRADYASLLERKRAARAADERRRPLESYRAEELALMRLDIFDDRRGFAAARHAFVTKQTRSPGRDTQTRSHLVSRPGPAAA
jgi:putative two-component system hydrogenase maturation factor HypX/HoxX